MATAQPILKVIQGQNPEDYAEYFDFEALRRVGMDHISRFSGKVWTDHNLHDPGITILEVLSYALLDLGYRSKLPLTDLLAQNNPGEGKDDNFFTPAEILTCNPLTINDYRKLLLDMDGVRNAWVEPADDILLSNVRKPDDCNSDGNIYLQGIYNVWIEPEDDLPNMPEGCICEYLKVLRAKDRDSRLSGMTQADFQECREEYLINSLKEVLNAHRNLCEDFTEPKLLCREELFICANIELEPDANPEAVWVEIMRRFRQFVNPDIRYYTLQEMLDKGKAIEEIFEGRPLSEKSVGFIDTEELEKFLQPKEFHLSDLFRIIAEIPGVLAVEKLVMNGVFDDGKPHYQNYGPWIYKLAPHHFPRANFARSCFNFSKNRTPIAGVSPTRQLALTRERLVVPRKSAVSTASKPILPTLPGEVPPSPYSRFDKPIPQGNFRSDLGDYFSVQNDFPVVYGIGEGHLPELEMPNSKLDDRQIIRKAQALQLKGYLLFFDQLLANYAAQLANLRQLFSMTPDDDPARTAAMQHTVFAQRTDSVPLIGQLIRFYDHSGNEGAQDGDALVFPVHAERLQNVITWLRDDTTQSRTLELGYLDFEQLEDIDNKPDCKSADQTFILKHAAFPFNYQRDGLVEQWSRDLRQNALRIEVVQDSCGFYFLIWSEDDALALMSRRRYDSPAAALQAAQDVLLLGNLPEIFRPLNIPAANPPKNIPPEDKDRYTFELVFRQADYMTFLRLLLEDEKLYSKRRNEFLDHILARFCERFTDHATLRYEAFLEKDKTQNRYKNDKARYAQRYDDLSRNRGRAFDYTRPAWNTANVSGLEAKTAALAGIPNYKRSGICVVTDQCAAEEFFYRVADYQGNTLFRSVENYPDTQSAALALQDLITAIKAGDNFQIARTSSGKYILSVAVGNAQLVPFTGTFDDEALCKKAITSLIWSFGGLAGQHAVHATKEAWQLNIIDHEGQVVRQGDKVFLTKNAAESGLKEIQNKGLKLAGHATGKTSPMYLFPVSGTSGQYLDLQSFRPGIVGSTVLGKVSDDARIEKKDKAWRIILQTAKRETLLEGTRFYPDEQRCKLALREWRKASKEGKVSIVATEDGAARLTLSDKNGGILARSRELSEIVAADYLDRCRALLHQEHLNPFLEKQDKPFYGFLFEDRNKATLLASFRVYETPAKAFEAMLQTPTFGAKKGQYILTGDEANPDYTYLLRDDKDSYIGYLPATFDKPADRNSRQKMAIELFSKWKAPEAVIPESERFSFRWNHPVNGAPLIVSKTDYPTEQEASRAFLQAIVEHEGFRINPKPHYYTMQLTSYAVEWTFGFQANLKGVGAEKTWFESASVFNRVDKAAAASEAFVKNLANAKPTVTEQKGQAIIQINPNANGDLIQSRPFASAKERDDALTELNLWLHWSEQLRVAITPIAQSSATAPRTQAAFNAFIYMAEPKESACFAIVKRDEPLAVHPCGEWILEAGDKNCQKWYSIFSWKTWDATDKQAVKDALKMYCGLSFFLEICLDGAGVTEKTEDCPAKYRFVFRTLKPFQAGTFQVPVGQILWQSANTYETTEEAIAAFQEHYLNVLTIATNIANYGGEGCIKFGEKPAEDPISPADPCPCQGSESPLGIEVPWSTLTLFDGMETNAAYYLSEAALSYPVFPVLHEEEQCDCGCSEASDCHCKKSVAASDPCTATTISKPSKFKFRLYDFGTGQQYKPGVIRWESTGCYETAKEALKWFKVFSGLLKNANTVKCYDNCHVVHACCSQDQLSIGVTEVIATSVPTVSMPKSGQTVASQVLPLNDVDALFQAIRSPGAFQPYYIPAPQSQANPPASNDGCGGPHGSECFSFRIAKEGYRFAIHPGFYENDDEAYAQAKKAFEKIGTGPKECLIVEKPAIPTKGVYFIKTKRKDGFVIQLMCANQVSIPVPVKTKKNCPPQYDEFEAEDMLLLETTGIYFDPPCATTPEVASQYTQEIVDHFCALLADFSNFAVTDVDACQPSTFELRDPAMIVAQHPNCYPTLAEAKAAIQRAKDCLYQETFYLLENILLRPSTTYPGYSPEGPACGLPLPTTTDCCLEWTPKPKEGCPEPETSEHYLPFTDPYSFWATVVIPCYTARFYQPDFRRFFEETIRYEAPAHVALCIRWLSPNDICRFESLYKKWLAWKSACSPKDDINPECDLIEFLQEVEDCRIDPVVETSACCDCKELKQTEHSKHVQPAQNAEPRGCNMPDEVICKSLFKTEPVIPLSPLSLSHK